MNHKRFIAHIMRYLYRIRLINSLLFVVSGQILIIFIMWKQKTGLEKELQSNVEEILMVGNEKQDLQEAELISRIEKELPALPYAFMKRNENKWLRVNKSCAVYPKLKSLNYYNNYWQTLNVQNRTIHLYAAYYDNRPEETRGVVIRILGMIYGYDEKLPQLYAQLWYDELTKPLIIKVDRLLYIWNPLFGTPQDVYYACLLSFALPQKINLIPKAVTLVETPCQQASNNLKIIYEPLKAKEQRKGFVVCVKGLDYAHEDISIRLVEWLEMQRILGAEKVVMHSIQQEHPNIAKILQYYQQEGFVELLPFSLGVSWPSLTHTAHLLSSTDSNSKRTSELIPYNDCLYRNMYKFEYVIVCDVDEVLMPLGNLTNWRQFVNELKKKYQFVIKSFRFRNIYFPNYSEVQTSSLNSEIPDYMFMLQHTWRVAQHSKENFYIKSMHSSDYAVALHNHYEVTCLNGCSDLSVDPKFGQMQHYREARKDENLLPGPVWDSNIWRFKTELVSQSKKVLENVGFLKRVKVINSSRTF